MKTYQPIKLLARVLAIAAISAMPGIIHAQTYSLFGITGMQQDDQTAPGIYTYNDHTLYRINAANGALTKIIRMPWVLDSQSIGYCATNGLIYHTGGDGAYRDGQNNVHDQDPADLTPGGAFQDNQYMGTVNLLTLAMAGVYNANPCPNPDNPTNEVNLPLDEQDGLYLPCFGLPAPIPPWVLPQYRRNTTQVENTNRITGPNEPSGIRGIAWSTELNSWYVSDGNLFKMSPDGMANTNLSTPEFLIPTDDLVANPTGFETNADLKAVAFIKTGGQTKLFGTYRMDSFTSGNTNGWIIELDPVTGTNMGQIALKYPPGGTPQVDEDPTNQFGGLLGLAQNPQTGVVYGIRKVGDIGDTDVSKTNKGVYNRELVTIDLATGNTTLVGKLSDGTYGQAITTLAFAADILITSITPSGSTLTIIWTGAAQPTYSLQTTASLSPPVTWTTLASGLSGPSTTTSITNNLGFFRISKP